jgi:hypothetical protein
LARPRKTSWLLTLLLMCTPLLIRTSTAQPATDNDREAATTLVRRAAALQAAGDHAVAIPIFNEAYSLLPDPIILFLKARSHVALEHYAEARDAYLAVRSYPEKVGPKNMLELERGLSRCNQELRETLVHVETPGVPGASLLLDGRFVGTTPLKLSLRRGTYTVRAQQQGYEITELPLKVAGEDELPLDIKLEASTSTTTVVEAPIVKPSPKVASSSGISQRAWAWTSLGVGAAALGVGLGFLGDYWVKQGRSISDNERWEGTTTNLTIGGTFSGVGALLASTAIFLFVTDRSDEVASDVGVLLFPAPSGWALGFRYDW